MVEWQAHACNPLSGARVDRFPISDASYSRLLSGGGTGSVTVPLDGSFEPDDLKSLVAPWRSVIALDRDGVCEYMGYPVGSSYDAASSTVTVRLVDFWSMAGRRGAWDHGASNVARWKSTITGTRATHAGAAVNRGRSGSHPSRGLPVTVPSFTGGTVITRTYYGYHFQFVADVLDQMTSEGIDIYFRPRWDSSTNEADWLMEAGPNWTTGQVRELFLSGSQVAGFTEDRDGARVSNGAVRVGEGTEEDVLYRTATASSLYPLLESVEMSKDVSSTSQLQALADQDVASFAEPTAQWTVVVGADEPVDVGDYVWLYFTGDRWMADGRYARRVVGIQGDLSARKKVLLQDGVSL